MANITSPILNALSRAPEQLLSETRHFIKHDVSQLLNLCAQSVQKSKLFPTSFREFYSYSQSDWLDVIPILCGVLVAITAPLLLLRNSLNTVDLNSDDTERRTKQARKAWRYNKVRTWLLRGQALCYGCGFLTSAIQHRSLWGKYGLNPARAPSSRPTPVFNLIGFSDLTLELVSWTGLLSTILLVSRRFCEGN